MLNRKPDRIYILLFLLLFATETCIALFVRDRIIRPYVGDILVVPLLYCFFRIFLSRSLRYLPLYLFIFAAFVEFLQIFNIPSMLGFAETSFIAVIMGQTFDVSDLLCYSAGAVLSALLGCFINKVDKKTNR